MLKSYIFVRDFPFNIQFIAFSVYYFFNCKLFLFVFSNFRKLLINCISARPDHQILSKKEYSSNFFMYFFSYLLACHNFTWNLKTIPWRPLIKKFINHWSNAFLISIIYWILTILNVLSRNTLSQAVLLGKLLKSP